MVREKSEMVKWIVTISIHYSLFEEVNVSEVSRRNVITNVIIFVITFIVPTREVWIWILEKKSRK